MMKKLIFSASILSFTAHGVTVPVITDFTNGSTISSSQMNTNFDNIQSSFGELNGLLPASVCSAGEVLSYTSNPMSCVPLNDASKLPLSGGTITGNLTISAAPLIMSGGAINMVGASINMGSNTIINVASPVNPQDVATKSYVDSGIAGVVSPFIPCAGGSCMSNTADSLGIGVSTISPTKLQVVAQAPAVPEYATIRSTLKTTAASATSDFMAGLFTLEPTHNVQNLSTLQTRINVGNSTANFAAGLYVKSAQKSSGGIVSNNGVVIDSQTVGTNNVGLLIETPATPSPNNYAIKTTGVEKSIFGGKVGIGTTTPAYALDVNGNINLNDCLYENGVSLVGTCTSDIRLKKNVKNFDWGLSVVENLVPKRYEYNGLAGTRPGIPQVGFIAQDLQKLAPELVKSEMKRLRPTDEEKTEILKIDYGKFTYVLFNAVRELSAKVKTLEASRTLASEKKTELETLREENAMMKAYLCAKDRSAPFCR